jgi:hypothetical protein
MLTVSVPCLFVNNTNHVLFAQDITGQYWRTLARSRKSLWCPPSYLKDENLAVKLSIPEISDILPNPVDCMTYGRFSIRFPILSSSNAFVPVNYDVVFDEFSYIVTFSHTITVVNDLDSEISLVPIESELREVGKAVVLGPRESGNIAEISEKSRFLFRKTRAAAATQLCLIGEVRTVFRYEQQLIELEVRENEKGLIAIIRSPLFPTAIVIANYLDQPIVAAQNPQNGGIEIQRKSTAMFGLDDPFGSATVHLLVGDNDFVASTVGDRDFVEVGKSDNDEPVFVSLATNYDGTRVLVISQDIEEDEVPFRRTLVWEVGTLSVSVIDRKVSEFLLITMSNIKIQIDEEGIDSTVGRITLGSLQIDDQNPLAAEPVVFHSESDSVPFLTVEALIRNRTSRFWSIVYGAVKLQPCSIAIDAAFVTDLLQAMRDFRLITSISSGYSPRLGLKWLETSGFNAYVRYKAMSDRPTITSEIERPIRPIPSLTRGHFATQGTLVKSVNNYFAGVLNDLFATSKFDIYKQAIAEYSRNGWLMKQVMKFATSVAVPISQVTRDITNTDELRERLSDSQIAHIEKQIADFHLSPSTAIERLRDPLTKVHVFDQASDAKGGIFKFIQAKKAFRANSDYRRVRTPQGFVNNRICAFDKDIAAAQLTVAQEFPAEKIRLSCRCHLKNDFVCVTDQFVFVFTPKVERMLQAIQITQVVRMSATNLDLILQGRKANETLSFRCSDAFTLVKFQTFISSQRCMVMVLGKSILR